MLPIHPTNRQVVRVISKQGALYNGFVQQWDGVSASRDREQCLVFEGNGLSLSAGKYKARLVGNQAGLPLYHVGNLCCQPTPFPSSSLSSGRSSATSITPPGSSSLSACVFTACCPGKCISNSLCLFMSGWGAAFPQDTPVPLTYDPTLVWPFSSGSGGWIGCGVSPFGFVSSVNAWRFRLFCIDGTFYLYFNAFVAPSCSGTPIGENLEALVGSKSCDPFILVIFPVGNSIQATIREGPCPSVSSHSLPSLPSGVSTQPVPLSSSLSSGGSTTSGGGTGGPCCGCATVPATYGLIVSGIINSSCTTCTSYNGNFRLVLGGSCTWTSGTNISTCSAGLPAVAWTLSCDATNMILTPSGSFSTGLGETCRYIKSRASWSCLGSNTLLPDFTSTAECSNWPASLTVVPS